MRVLICDDDPSIRLLFRSAFEQYGLDPADIAEAVDGPDTLATAERTQPSLVVLDIFMPGADGLTILPALREACPDTRVYVVSAHASPDAFDEGLARGAAACFDKLDFLTKIPALLGN